MRIFISQVITKLEELREKKADRILNIYLKEELSVEQKHFLYKSYFKHLAYGIDEYDHSDLEIDAIVYADSKVEKTEKEELRAWWAKTRYYKNIFFHKINKFILG